VDFPLSREWQQATVDSHLANGFGKLSREPGRVMVRINVDAFRFILWQVSAP
jgi:hypothetical protein